MEGGAWGLVEVYARGRLASKLLRRGIDVSPDASVEVYTADGEILGVLEEEPATVVVRTGRLVALLARLAGLPVQQDGVVAARCRLGACRTRIVDQGFTGMLRILADMLMHSEAGRMARFAVVGATGIPVNVAVWLLLVRILGIAGRGGIRGYALPDLLASETAILWNFAWNERWTFSDLDLPRSLLGVASRLLRYNAISLAGVGLLIVVHGLLMSLGLGDLSAYLLGIFFVFIYNYVFSRLLAWRGRPAAARK